MSTETPEPARVERRRWCRCSVAQRARHDFNPECLLHGNTADAALYRDGLADGRSERDAEHAACADRLRSAESSGEELEHRLAAVEAERDRAEAESASAQADYDRRGERLWRMAALAGHEPCEADNDATAEYSVKTALAERDRLRAALDAVETLADWRVGRSTNGVDRMIPASDLRAVLDQHPGADDTREGA